MLRNEHRTTNQMTGSVWMKKRKNENFSTAVSLPDFVLFPLLTFMLSYVQTDAQTPNIAGWPNMLGVCCVRLHVDKRLTGFKLCATTCNRVDVQTDATCEIQHCCVRLHGALVKPSQSKGQDQPVSQGSLPGRVEKNAMVRARRRLCIRHF